MNNQITYANKVALNQNSSIPDINKVNATDMNEIKRVVNGTINGSIRMGNIQTNGLIMKEGDLVLSTPNSSTDDSRDIVFNYGNGQEKARLWTENDLTNIRRLNFRSYSPSGVPLENGLLGLVNDIKIMRVTASVTVPGNSISKYDLATISVPSGYRIIGVLPLVNGFGDQWLVSTSYYSNKIVAMVQSKYSSSLTSTIECYVIFFKQDYYDKILIS